jgi:predicted lipid-binding transport protein (Tim44 family)
MKIRFKVPEAATATALIVGVASAVAGGIAAGVHAGIFAAVAFTITTGAAAVFMFLIGAIHGTVTDGEEKSA